MDKIWKNREKKAINILELIFIALLVWAGVEIYLERFDFVILYTIAAMGLIYAVLWDLRWE